MIKITLELGYMIEHDDWGNSMFTTRLVRLGKGYGGLWNQVVATCRKPGDEIAYPFLYPEIPQTIKNQFEIYSRLCE